MSKYKSTFEKEINLAEVRFYCLKRWRWIVGAMLIVAIIVGGYKCVSTRRTNQIALQEWDKMELETEVETEAPVDNSDLLKSYRSLVERNEEALYRQEEYLKNSVVMQMDANHLQKGILSYVLNTEDAEQETSLQSTLISAYRAYATDGRLAQLVYSDDKKTAIPDMQYRIAFSYTAAGSILNADEMTIDVGKDVFFQISIISTDMDSCEKYLKRTIQGIQTYSKELQNQVGEHELTLLASNITEVQDQTIQNYQASVLNNYVSAVRNVSALRTEEKTFADSVRAALITPDISDENDGPILASPVKTGIKYGVMGLVLGIFLVGVVLIIQFIMNDRLHSTENFEIKYDIRLLGHIVEPIKGKGVFGFFDRWLQQLEEGPYVNLPYEEQVKIVLANVKMAIPSRTGEVRVMLAGTMAAKDAGPICDIIMKGIESVAFSDYRQLIFDASAMEELGSYDGILFIEKKDVSSSRLIWQEGKTAKEHDMNILGAVVM